VCRNRQNAVGKKSVVSCLLRLDPVLPRIIASRRGEEQCVGEVGLRKPHPRPATLATFGPRTASVSWRNLRCTGANKNANTAYAV
jgi:hypothetical protein